VVAEEERRMIHIKGNYFENNDQALTAFDPKFCSRHYRRQRFVAGPIGRPWQIEWYFRY